jgi:hypothetical protein
MPVQKAREVLMGSTLTSVVVDLTPEEIDSTIPVDRRPNDMETQLAQRAVTVHAIEQWPHGASCRNCRAPFPCRLHRWGRRMLNAAGWDDVAIACGSVRSAAALDGMGEDLRGRVATGVGG